MESGPVFTRSAHDFDSVADSRCTGTMLQRGKRYVDVPLHFWFVALPSSHFLYIAGVPLSMNESDVGCEGSAKYNNTFVSSLFDVLWWDSFVILQKGFEGVNVRHFAVCRQRIVVQARRWMLEAHDASVYGRYERAYGELVVLLDDETMNKFECLEPLADDIKALESLEPAFTRIITDHAEAGPKMAPMKCWEHWIRLTSMFQSTSSMKVPRELSPTFDVFCSFFSLAPSCSSLQQSARHETKYICHGCGRAEEAEKAFTSFIRCACCKSTYYCGQACQKDWLHDGVAIWFLSHRHCCFEFLKDKQECMESPIGMAVRTHVFPWANRNDSVSNVFPLQDVLQRRGLNEHLGFWERPECTLADHLEGDEPERLVPWADAVTGELPSIEEGFVQLSSRDLPSGSPCSSSRLKSWSEQERQ